MKADKLASFRLDNQLWEDFKAIAANNGTTATALLIGYIQSVVNTGNVIASTPQSIQPSIDNSPTMSIQNIDKRIDDKIKTAVQHINTQSIQDIDDTVKKLIAESLQDGDIGEAINKSYAAMMGNFNELLDKVEELKAAIPPVPVPSPQSPMPNAQLPETVEAGVRSQEAGENLTAGGDGGECDRNSSNEGKSPNLDKPKIILQDGFKLPISSKQETVLNLLGLIPHTQKLLTSQFLSETCKDHLTTNKGELESLIGEKIDTKGSTIRKTVFVLRRAGFVMSGSEGDGVFISNVK